MNWKEWLGNYGLPAILAVVFLIFLPPFLTPYMGIFGTYTAYVVSFIVLLAALWVGKLAKKHVIE